MTEHYDAIVVGAGITGASTAYHLVGAGLRRVLLLERGAPASGGTGKSAAVVRQHYSTPLLARLAKQSVGMLQSIDAEIGGGAFSQCGYVMLIPPDLKAAAEGNMAMQRDVGVDTRWLDDDEIDRMLPWINRDGVAGVVYEKEGGYADPVRVTEAYVSRFQKIGGEFRERTPCRGLLRDGDRVSGVLLEDGEIMAGAVVNAAGPWAAPLAIGAGIEIPLRSVREQDSIWQARENRQLPDKSVSNAVDAIYLRPMGEGRFLIGQGFPKDYIDVDPYNYREAADADFINLILQRADRRFPTLAGMTPYNYREAADADFINLILQRADRRFPTLAGMTLVTAYAALYDVTPDWYPFIGPRRGLKGYFDACGGSGHGFKIGPAIGQALAGWIAEGRVEDDFARLSHDRLAEGRLFTGAYGGNRG